MSTSKLSEILIKRRNCMIKFYDWLLWKNLVEEIFENLSSSERFCLGNIGVSKGKNHKNKFLEKYLSEKYISLR